MEQGKRIKLSALHLSAKSMVSTLLLLFAMLMPQGAWALDFISEVKYAVNSNQETASMYLSGYTTIYHDFNNGTSGDWVYIGYKKSNKPQDAITGLLIVTNDTETNSTIYGDSGFKAGGAKTMMVDGKRYYLAEYEGNVDMNHGNKTHKNPVYLYYTKDGNTDIGANLIYSLGAYRGELTTNPAGKKVVPLYGGNGSNTNGTYTLSKLSDFGDTNKGGGGSFNYITYTTHTHNFAPLGQCNCKLKHVPSGSGTENDPYLISYYYDLEWFRDKVNSGDYKCFAKQIADITCPTSDGWIWAEGIGDVSDKEKMFQGIYDGNMHTISGFKIYANNYKKAFFGGVYGGGIKNLGFINVYVADIDNHGNAVFIHKAVDARIIDCYVIGQANYSFCYSMNYKTAISLCYAWIKDGWSYFVHDSDYGQIGSCFTNEEFCDKGFARASSSEYRVTIGRFRSGEIAYTLSRSYYVKWYQKIGTDDFPSLQESTGNTVYMCEEQYCSGREKSTSYTNDPNMSGVKRDPHTKKTDFTIDADATCYAAGSKSKHCVYCDEKLDVTEIPILSHIMTEHAATNATCTTNGNELYYTCSQSCCSGKYYIDNAVHTSNAYANYNATVRPMLNHNYNTEGICANDASHYLPAILSADYYQITNYGNLCWFRNEANSGKTIKGKLTADINLSGKAWSTSIGEGTAFGGVFDGQGHTITGNARKALFCVLAAGSTVKNVVAHGGSSKDNYENAAYQSPFVRRNYGTIENCIVKSAYWDSRSSYLGGITGVNETGGIVRNCGFYDSTLRLRNSANTQVGGIVGVNCANGRIENCFTWGINYYNIGSLGSGGIVCENRSGAIVSNCYTNVATPVFKQEGTATSMTSGITAAFITTGEMCYKLNGGTTNGTQKWYQKIGTETFPTPMVKNVSNTVYQGEVNNGNFYVNENGTLASIAINDGAPFASPVGFTANSVTYTRNGIKNQWGTIVVPFDVTNGDDYDFYTLSDVSGDELTLTKVDGTLTAGTPALIRFSSELVNGKTYDLTLTAESNAVNAQGTLAGTPAGDLTLIGSYSVKGITDENGYIISNNKFWSIQEVKGSNNVYCAPFRAYLRSSSPVGAKQLNIGQGKEATAIEAITAITEGEAEYYDINGHRINSLQKGMNIIRYSNGKTKKVVIK